MNLQKRSYSSRRWLGVLALLALYLASRLHNLDALPLFQDESLYIDTAQRVREGQFLNSAVTNGRLLHVWYNAALSPYPPAIGWVARAGMAIAGLAGLVAFYNIARSMFSRQAGLIALLLWLTTPYLLLYERMTLADTMLNITSVILVWVAWTLAQTGRRDVALGLGVALFVALLAKVTALVWLPLPAIAALFVQQGGQRKRLILAGLAYSAFAALAVPFWLALRWKRYDYLGLGDAMLGGVDSSLWDRAWHNIQLVWHVDIAYLSWPVVLLAILGGVFWLKQRPRSALFTLLVLGMIAGGSLLFGRDVNSRRVVSHVPWVILSLAAGITLLIERKPRWRPAVYTALGVWIAAYFAPFQLAAWNTPADLPLYGNDVREYVTGEASGYGVTRVGQHLRDAPNPLPTLGFVANCLTLRYAAYPVDVTCPKIAWDGASQAQLMQQAETWAAEGPIYVVAEPLVYVDLAELPAPHSAVMVVDRPGGDQPVTLYRLEHGARRPAKE